MSASHRRVLTTECALRRRGAALCLSPLRTFLLAAYRLIGMHNRRRARLSLGM